MGEKRHIMVHLEVRNGGAPGARNHGHWCAPHASGPPTASSWLVEKARFKSDSTGSLSRMHVGPRCWVLRRRAAAGAEVHLCGSALFFHQHRPHGGPRDAGGRLPRAAYDLGQSLPLRAAGDLCAARALLDARRISSRLLGAPEGGGGLCLHVPESSCDSCTCTQMLLALDWCWWPYWPMTVFERVYEPRTGVPHQ